MSDSENTDALAALNRDAVAKVLLKKEASEATDASTAGKTQNYGPDNAKEFFTQPDGRWTKRYEILRHDAVRGKEPPGAQQRIAEWKQRYRHANVLVVTGQDLSATQWMAESFALLWKAWDETRWTNVDGFGGIKLEQVIGDDILDFNAKRCLVVECWDSGRCNDTFRSLKVVSEAISKYSDQSYGLVLFAQGTVFSDHPDRKEWPDNILIAEVPVPGGSTRPGPTIETPNFRRLFGSEGVTTLEQVARVRRQTIEQTLARICVLFGDLPEGDLEELLSAALGTQTVTLDPSEGEKTGQSMAFMDLWRSAKGHFLQKAGLVARLNETPCRIGFQTEDIRSLATEAAWVDAQAMIEIFRAVNEMTLLFDDESTRHRRALYRGYISAAVMLARRSPLLYGAHWLEEICVQYVAWAARKLPAIDLSKHDDLLSVLFVLAEQQQTNDFLWHRFTGRMGDLCRPLCDDSVGIVEDFLTRLETKKLYDVLWALVLELKGTQLNFGKWVARVLNAQDYPETAKRAMRAMALRAIDGRNAAVDFHTLFATNLPAKGSEPKNPFQCAALAFPATVLAIWYRRIERSGSTPASLGTFLDLPLETNPASIQSIRAYWVASFSSPAFEKAARQWIDDDEIPADFSLALALYQIIALSPSGETAASLQMAKEVRLADTKRWRSLCIHWKTIVEILSAELVQLSPGQADRERRNALNHSIRACRQLHSL